MTPIGFRSFSSTRALQTPDPPNETTGRILSALRAGRVGDAAGVILLLPYNSLLDHAWKDYLHARTLAEQGDFVRAKAMAQQAASTALRLGISDPKDLATLRLASAALELEGIALRRQDQPLEASRIHLAAHSLRQDCGTHDEQAESAMSLGSCAEWIGDLAAAERWYRIAGNLTVASADQARRKSSALIRLSTLLTKLARHRESIEEARSAQELLDEYLAGDIAAISAGLQTAQAMIHHIEELLGSKTDSAPAFLGEIFHLLQYTRESLLGFGPAAEGELAWCDEQLDFVDRLRQTLSCPN